MAGYLGRVLEQYGLPVYSHVIYLRPDAGRHDRGEYGKREPFTRLARQTNQRLVTPPAGAPDGP